VFRKKTKKRILNILGLFIGFFLLAVFGTKFISWMSGKFYLSNPSFHILFSINVLLLLVIFVFLIRNIFLLFVPYRSTRLRFKFVTAFSLLILGPALFAVFISTNFINRGLDRLFKLQMKRSIETAVSVGSSTFDLLSKDTAALLKTFPSFYKFNLEKANLKGVCRIIGRKVECRGKIKVEPEIIKKVIDVSGIYTRIDRKNRDLTVCIRRGGRFYCGSRGLSEDFLKNLTQLEQLRTDYKTFKVYEKPIKGIYTITFLVMGVIVLVGAFWFARYFEKMINTPVEALYRATNKISRGDLNVRIEEEGAEELKNVIAAFNYMVEQLKALKEKIESEKAYIENVINSISPVVITVSRDGRVISFNRAAEGLFQHIEKEVSVMELFTNYNGFGDCVKKLILSLGGKDEIAEIIDGRERVFSVEIVNLPENEGFVIIMEDITDIINAQKASAWKEVAQRLAHEIKNPLTPISLSAERVKRLVDKQKFSEDVKNAVYKSLSLILEEVESIKRLIDEFRTFARLPLPDKRLENINRLVEDFISGYRDKVYVEFLPSSIPEIPVDKRLLREVLLNLMENSIEAGANKVSITPISKHDKVFLIFKDNGPGIPEDLGESVFSPHVSTKKAGWGLGLAIAKKIIEDHGGRIFLIDKNTFVIELPL